MAARDRVIGRYKKTAEKIVQSGEKQLKAGVERREKHIRQTLGERGRGRQAETDRGRDRQ